MPISTITSKGQTTVPGEIRRHLKLKAGDRLGFFIGRDGKVVLEPMTVDVRELDGLLAPAPRRLTVEEMNEAIRDRAVRKYVRSRGGRR